MVSKMSFAIRVTHAISCVLPYSWLPAFIASKKLQKSEIRKKNGRWHRKFNCLSLKRQKKRKEKVSKRNN